MLTSCSSVSMRKIFMMSSDGPWRKRSQSGRSELPSFFLSLKWRHLHSVCRVLFCAWLIYAPRVGQANLVFFNLAINKMLNKERSDMQHKVTLNSFSILSFQINTFFWRKICKQSFIHVLYMVHRDIMASHRWYTGCQETVFDWYIALKLVLTDLSAERMLYYIVLILVCFCLAYLSQILGQSCSNNKYPSIWVITYH